MIALRHEARALTGLIDCLYIRELSTLPNMRLSSHERKGRASSLAFQVITYAAFVWSFAFAADMRANKAIQCRGIAMLARDPCVTGSFGMHFRHQHRSLALAA
jgi:hypothetical protein